jgi:hypothetical protein
LWKGSGGLPESVAAGRIAGHSYPMSDSGRGARFYWCMRHHRVENGDNACPAKYLLGPYPSAADAAGALQQVQQRNEAWEAEDARWAGEES